MLFACLIMMNDLLVVSWSPNLYIQSCIHSDSTEWRKTCLFLCCLIPFVCRKRQSCFGGTFSTVPGSCEFCWWLLLSKDFQAMALCSIVWRAIPNVPALLSLSNQYVAYGLALLRRQTIINIQAYDGQGSFSKITFLSASLKPLGATYLFRRVDVTRSLSNPRRGQSRCIIR